VLDSETREVLFGRLEKERREVASLTKILTLYTVLNLTESLGLSFQEPVTVDESVLEVIGTSANLTPGDILTVE
jgi:D-alanyl-D-alanine carboxypeptidase